MAAPDEEMPQSVEEAGALLGSTVIRYGSSTYVTTNPPKGIHSSFATISPVPSSELLNRLHSLRSLLRSAPRDTPLVAAPSLLAGVLMKLLGISNNLAANMSSTVDPTRRTDIPPMLSTPVSDGNRKNKQIHDICFHYLTSVFIVGIIVLDSKSLDTMCCIMS